MATPFFSENVKSAGKDNAGGQSGQRAPADFIATAAFKSCPDCADQGGEWIEIRFADGKAKKVTFDYNRPPEEVLDPIPNKPTPR
jgi:hypothetical protein